MALNWNWKTDKIGRMEVTEDTKTYTYNLYSGNALMIQIWEDENKYQVCGFWCDKAHMKNCLGLTKGYDNIYANQNITIELDSNYRYTPDIASALCKANWNDDITIIIKHIPFKRG